MRIGSVQVLCAPPFIVRWGSTGFGGFYFFFPWVSSCSSSMSDWFILCLLFVSGVLGLLGCYVSPYFVLFLSDAEACLVWILGHSYVYWAARRAEVRPEGRQLGWDRGELSVGLVSVACYGPGSCPKCTVMPDWIGPLTQWCCMSFIGTLKATYTWIVQKINFIEYT